jgi:Flp pilus assembly protein TadG
MFMQKLLNFITDKSGNVAIIFSLTLVPIMFSVGISVDYSKIARIQSRLQETADTAAFHAIKGHVDGDYGEEEITEIARQMVTTNYNIHPSDVDIQLNVQSDTLTVHLETDYSTAFLKAFHFGEVTITAKSEVVYEAGKQPVSLFLVLDRSGSMAWTNNDGGSKMDSLQVAVNNMINELKASDPEKKYIRMGAVAYNSSMWTPQSIRWNLDYANQYVQDMSANGGTDSSDAVIKAYNKLKKPAELSEHFNRNGSAPDLVMIFMTDGNNNYSSDDTSTINTCNNAKSYGMEIYTVAFQAPSNGQQLLSNCASDSAHYFEPENTDQLIEAFKDIGIKVGEKITLTK